MARQTEIQKLERRYEEKPSQWFAALAEEYRRAGDVDRALEIVRKGLEQRSSYVSGHVVLARCLLQQSNDGEAEQVLKQVLVLDSENIIALKVLSEIKERANDSAAALEWLEKLLEVDPMNQDAQEAVERLSPPAPAEVDAGAPDEGLAPDEHEDDVATEKMTAVEFEEAGLADTAPAEEDEQAVPAGSHEEVSVLETIPADPSSEAAGEAVAAPGGAGGGGEGGDAPVEPPSADLAATESAGVGGGDAAEPESAAPAASAAPASMADEVEPAAAAEVASEAVAPEPAESPVDVPTAGSDVGEMEPPEALAAEPQPETVPDEPGAEVVPEASPAEAVPAAVAESEPEPVVTETMADVYVSQGLYAEARAVYEQLLERRPDDTGLQAKLADLDGAGVRVGGDPSPERPESTPVQVFAASETGGLSARAFVTRVLAATVGTPSHQASPGEGDAASSAASPSDAAPAPPEEPSPLEAAFEAPEPADVDAPGEPTQPAADSPSLAAVFDETPDVSGGQSPPSPHPRSRPPPDAEQPDGEPAAKDGEMSFDEFFGDGQAQAPTGETPDPAADPADDVREDRDFKDWLKGLKS